ncbi:MAG: ABC transporter permease, partial [Rhodothermales bacterium]
MLKNYATVALRNLVNQKSYAAINIVGLALGLAAFLVIAQYVSFELSYDRFHENVDDIYRVRHDSYRDGVSDGSSAQTFAGLAAAMKENIPEVVEATHFFALDGGITLSSDNVVHNERQILFADASFLQLFSFPMKAGSSGAALAQPNSVVLTATSARKYFGESDPVGKLLTVQKNDSGLDLTVTVTGVVEDPPPNSHIQFDVLLSIGTGWAEGNWGDPGAWDGPSHYTYANLAPDASPEAVAAGLPLLVNRYAGGNLSRTNATARLSLQPLRDIRLYSLLEDELTPAGTGVRVWTLAGAGFFILIIAWVNYVNLATARSMRRAREVGLRKLVGAGRGELVKQFMLEADTIF